MPEETESDKDFTPYLKTVKNPRTDRQAIAIEYLVEHTTVFEDGRIDVMPALETIREELDDGPQKSYLHQIAGEFTAPVYPIEEVTVDENAIYRQGYRDGQNDAFTRGVEWAKENL